MSVSVEGDFANPLQQLPESRIASNVVSEDERIDEETNQSLSLDLGAAGDRRAHKDIRLSGVPIEQRFERRQQCHEDSRALLPAQLFDRFVQAPWQIQC